VTFLLPEEGGRSHLAENSSHYRPSLVFGDPDKRQPDLGDDGRTLTELYRMSAFDGDGTALLPDREHEVFIRISYYPDHRGYEKPSVGDTFTIREANRIVGFGRLLSIADS
jgi:hypothetical protein